MRKEEHGLPSVKGMWDANDERLYQFLSGKEEDAELSTEEAAHLTQLERRRKEEDWTVGAYPDDDLVSEIDVFLDKWVGEVSKRDEEVQDEVREMLIYYVEENL